MAAVPNSRRAGARKLWNKAYGTTYRRRVAADLGKPAAAGLSAEPTALPAGVREGRDGKA
jgi:hypothetical protein